MLIAHISDFHVFSRQPETKLVRPDIVDAARKIVDDICRFTPAIEGVMFTGDVADGGSDEDYALLADILAPIKVPVFMVPGNHDSREPMRRAFKGRLPFRDEGFLNYEERLGDYRILALDTLIEGAVEGELAPESLDWLAERLPAGGTQPTLLLLHHPPFTSGIEALDRLSLIGGRSELGEMVRAYGGPLVLLAGHVHRPYKALWNGIHCAVGGSPAFQIELDLIKGDHDPALVPEPYSYFVYRLDPQGGGLVAHTRYVGI